MNARKKEDIAIIIPTLNPEVKTISFIKRTREKCNNPIIVINDGSKKECDGVFEEIEKLENCILLHHSVNLGKGRALKTGFNYYMLNYSGKGVVTADGDGQHDIDDIIKCTEVLKISDKELVLGVRDFSQNHVPWKSALGNKLTRTLLALFLKCKIQDSQTGLRGIPPELLHELMNCPGERFEFETAMLFLAKKNNIKFHLVPIRTIYEDNNKGTHFDPVIDSVKIYLIIIKYGLTQFFTFILSSLSSAAVDISLFSILFHFILSGLKNGRLFISVALARICSLLFNYYVNKHYVFNKATNQRYVSRSFLGYICLCVVIMSLSYGLTKWMNILFSNTEITYVKICVDLFLFILSYTIQKHIIFK